MGPKSIALLGSNFVMHVLERATLTYDRGGTKRFRANFDHQGLLPLDESARLRLPDWHTCLACGLCDAVCPELLGVATRERFVGPQAMASGMIRDLAGAGETYREVAPLIQCEGCNACEAICPSDLPLRSIATFFDAYGREARASATRES